MTNLDREKIYANLKWAAVKVVTRDISFHLMVFVIAMDSMPVIVYFRGAPLWAVLFTGGFLSVCTAVAVRLNYFPRATLVTVRGADGDLRLFKFSFFGVEFFSEDICFKISPFGGIKKNTLIGSPYLAVKSRLGFWGNVLSPRGDKRDMTETIEKDGKIIIVWKDRFFKDRAKKYRNAIVLDGDFNVKEILSRDKEIGGASDVASRHQVSFTVTERRKFYGANAPGFFVRLPEKILRAFEKLGEEPFCDDRIKYTGRKLAYGFKRPFKEVP